MDPTPTSLEGRPRTLSIQGRCEPRAHIPRTTTNRPRCCCQPDTAYTIHSPEPTRTNPPSRPRMPPILEPPCTSRRRT
eukprot:467088-Rhodomonas_salina.3